MKRITIAFTLTAIVFFFVASNWYFQISGNSFDSSLFTDIESSWNSGSSNFSQIFNQLGTQKTQLIQNFSQNPTATSTQ